MSTTPKLDDEIDYLERQQIGRDRSDYYYLQRALIEIREHLQRIPAPRYPSELESRLYSALVEVRTQLRNRNYKTALEFIDKTLAELPALDP